MKEVAPMASVNRRTFLGGLAASAAAPLLRAQPRGTDRLLDEIERRACAYFYEQADPETGLVLDRAGLHTPYVPAASSIAATGFGLSAMCIADQRGYLDTPVARDRIVRTLRFLIDGAAHEHGLCSWS